jgi:hypothetical protein
LSSTQSNKISEKENLLRFKKIGKKVTKNKVQKEDKKAIRK